jgi:hypothetical protein
MKTGVLGWCCGMLVFLSGCGCSGGTDSWSKTQPDTVPAGGVVTLDGKPLSGASVVFAPVPPGKHSASGVTNSSGAFSVRAFPSKTGAVPGTYKVCILKQSADGAGAAADPKTFGEDAAHAEASPAPVQFKSEVPTQYESPETSGLVVQIPGGGDSALKIELKSKP